MLIIVDVSLIEEVITGNARATAMLNDIISNIRDGYHLIRIDIDIVDLILDKVVKADDMFHRPILEEYRDRAVELTSPLPGITEGRIIFWQNIRCPQPDIDRLRQGVPLIGINLQHYLTFRLNTPTHLWGEGDDDCEFLLKIGKAFKEKNESPIELYFENRQGGGGTLGSFLYGTAKFKDRFHLAMCDNDKHYDDEQPGIADYASPSESEKKNLGGTAKSLLGVYPDIDSKLVGIYIYKYTSELENLIPWVIVKSVYPYPFSHNIYEDIDKSYFDIKSGMKIKNLMSSQEYYNYWYPILTNDAQFKIRIDQLIIQYRNLLQAYETETDDLRKIRAKEFFDNFQNTVILEGKKILKNIKDSHTHFSSLGSKAIYENLTQPQKREWDEIGALVLTYGAAGRAYLN